MNQKVHKVEIKNRVRDKLRDERYVIGGNGKGHKYSKKYKLRYTRKIVNKVVDALLDVIVEIIEDGDIAIFENYLKIEPSLRVSRLRTKPFSGEKYIHPAYYTFKASAGRRIKEAYRSLTERELNNKQTAAKEAD